MKPAPPEELSIKINGYVLKSTPSNVSGHDKTSIYKAGLLSKDFLWDLDVYVGQRQLYLSDDGLILILFGNVYFRNTVKNDEASSILEIYEKNKQVQSFPYNQITSVAILEDVKKHNLPEFGGGWVDISKVLEIKNVDWKKRKIFFLHNKIEREISF